MTSPGEIRDSEAFRNWIEYSYGSHAEAAAHFRSAGLSEIDIVPRYESPTVRSYLQGIMKKCAPDVKVMDLTASVPTSASGTLLPMIKTLMTARKKTEENPNVMWYLQRTEKNTPAFAHMFAYGAHVGAGGGRPLCDSAYCGLVLFRGMEITVPARMAVGSAQLVADVIATNANVNYHGFKCAICNGSFAKWTQINGQNVRALDEMVITDCDHVLHPGCVLGRVANGEPNADKCPTCGDQLPWSTYATRSEEAEGLVGAAMDGRPSHFIGNTEQYKRAQEAATCASSRDPYMASIRANINAGVFERTGVNTALVALEERIADAPFLGPPATPAPPPSPAREEYKDWTLYVPRELKAQTQAPSRLIELGLEYMPRNHPDRAQMEELLKRMHDLKCSA